MIHFIINETATLYLMFIFVYVKLKVVSINIIRDLILLIFCIEILCKYYYCYH